MKKVPELDLHPDALPSSRGPLEALQACRRFLEAEWEAGTHEVRLITGLGLHGDGSPRLRLRIQAEVLPAFATRIEHTALVQGGAVLAVTFKKRARAASQTELRHLHHEKSRQEWARQEERLGVARQRYEQAWEYLREDDFRRARLKVNQLLREFVPEAQAVGESLDEIRRALDVLDKKLGDLGA